MNTYIYIWPRAFTSYCKALNETVHRIAGAPYIYTTDPLLDPPFTNVLEHYIYIYDRPFSGPPFWTAPQNRLFEFIGSKTLYIYIRRTSRRTLFWKAPKGKLAKQAQIASFGQTPSTKLITNGSVSVQ